MSGRNLSIILILFFVGALGLALYPEFKEKLEYSSAKKEKPLSLACTWDRTNDWVKVDINGKVKDFGSRREDDVLLKSDENQCVWSGLVAKSFYKGDAKIRCTMVMNENDWTYDELVFLTNRYTGIMTRKFRKTCTLTGKSPICENSGWAIIEEKEDQYRCSDAKKKF